MSDSLVDVTDCDLFDRSKALSCFGNDATVSEVISPFLQQIDPRLQRLRHEVLAGDYEAVRKSVHWLRGGLSYLFSPAAQRACLQFDQETREQLPADIGVSLTLLESVFRRLRERFIRVGSA